MKNQTTHSPSLDERSEMIRDAADKFKYIPQTVSVITLTVIIIGLVAQFFNVSPTSQLYIAIQVLGGAVGAFVGFKLEKAIETFFCYPIHALRDEGSKALTSAQFIFTSLTALLLLTLSLFLSLGGKNQAVAEAMTFSPADVSDQVTQILTTQTSSHDATALQLECEREVNARYDDLIAKSKSSARRAKNEADRNWLMVGNVKKLESERDKALKQCAIQYAAERDASARSVEAASETANRLIAFTEQRNQTLLSETKAAQSRYSFYLGYIIWISLPLSLLLYTVRVLSEKK